MRNLRGRIVARVMAFTLLLIFLQSVFLPHYTFALTTGPHQPEYTSYEGPGATDMVNLLTGDFSFSLPVLEVPGPEGSFSLPLSYNAGIGLDQEASWVGLGWTMNAGAITRNINGFPDDAAGESQLVTVQDLTGVRGWTSSLMGLGSIGWNTEVGHYGSIGLLGISWDESGFQLNPIVLGLSILSIASTVGSINALSQAMGAKAMTADIALKAASSSASIGMDIMNYAGQIANNIDASSTPVAPNTGYWKYSKRTQQRLFHKNYWIWLDQSRFEDMYGTLYLGKTPGLQSFSNSSSDNHMDLLLKNGGVAETLYQFPKTATSNKGTASDINYDADGDYYDINKPAVLASDSYSVKAVGISGNISPYRLDVGSVSMPREMTKYHTRLAPVRYLDYKVPFIYDGTLSNAYFHHSGGSASVTSPGFYTGYTLQVQNTTASSNTSLTYNLNDVVLKNERVKSSINGTKKIPQANHIEWLSNAEISSSTTYPSGFVDFLGGTDRTSFRANFATGSSEALRSSLYVSTNNFSPTLIIGSTNFNDFQEDMPVELIVSAYNTLEDLQNAMPLYVVTIEAEVQSKNSSNYSVTFAGSGLDEYLNGLHAEVQIKYNKNPQIQNSIGGYSITSADGTTYHFALPVYDYDLKTEMRNVADHSKKSIISRVSPFANTWLLTAITGSDFVDRNANGLADDEDWGFWVKLNYGKHVDDFKWRLPYSDFKRSWNNESETYSQGYKQLYYLNSIETRSHVALFSKATRWDSRSADNTRSSLRLAEIVLLSKENYNVLVNTHGLPQFSNKIDNVCMGFSTPQRNYINSQCLKRIVLTTSYDLCPGTQNSVNHAENPTNSKLTLTKVSIFGKNNDKLTPDYKFEYGYNPSYNKDHWDGWGYYNQEGTSNGTTHKVSQSNGDQYGAAWSLTKIINPLGSEIMVSYQRDTYSSISGVQPQELPVSFEQPGYTPPSSYFNTIPVFNSGTFQVGDRISVEGYVSYVCPGTSTPVSKTFNMSGLTITSATSNSITVDQSFLSTNECSGTVTLNTFYGSVTKYYVAKKGDGLRVASIIMKNEFGEENKIRYLYTDSQGNSSGVVAKEPDYIGTPLPFYNTPLYPNTPVIYGAVTVLSGKLTSDSDYHTRQVYEFETPHTSMIATTKTTVKARTLAFQREIFEDLLYHKEYMEAFRHDVAVRTSKIGSLKSIKTYSKASAQPVSESTMVYTDVLKNNNAINHQGVYTQGTLMVDRVEKKNQFEWYNKFNRTTVISYPWTLQKVINTKDGHVSEVTNLSWDILTGMVDQKLEKSNLGLYIKTVTKPAYTVAAYSEMGPKATNISNKNMLGQIAATYVYKSNASGANLGLIGAALQTWSKTWPSHSVYSVATPYGASSNVNAWRKSEAYSWKGTYSRLQADGTHTFNISDEFNFSGTPNANWQRVGGIDRYDQYSMPVQTSNYDTSIFSAVRLGYDNRIKIAEASNAKYDEIAFCSAEDRIGTTAYFYSSGIKLFNGTVLRKSKNEFTATNTGDNNLYGPHTGDAAIMVNANGKTFSYTPPTSGLTPDRTYRASVWTNSPNGRIYYSIDGGTDVISSVPTTDMKAGKWYLLSMEITIPGTPASFEVGVKSVSGKVVFDDFRFQPVDASMTCYVYSPLDFEYSTDFTTSTYVLDNDNLYTRYDESGDGRLSKVYRETMSFGSNDGYRLISETTSDFRRFHTE